MGTYICLGRGPKKTKRPKLFALVKDIAKKTKWQAGDWEKMCAIYISDKKLIFRIQEKLLPLRQTIQQKMDKKSEQTLLRRRGTDGE